MNSVIDVVLYGASGHGKVVCSVVENIRYSISGVFDDFTDIDNLNGYSVLGKYDQNIFPKSKMLISIGDNKIRKNISEVVGHEFITLCHHSALIDRLTTILCGTVVFHGVIIQRDCMIGKHCILNTNVSIDHECLIHNYVSIGPSSTLCGNVEVCEGANIGAGAIILPNLKIGKWAVVGAGAVVTKNVPDYSVVVGVPAKVIKLIS